MTVKSASIPIRNIYYLLCYSWNQLTEGNLVDVSGTPSTDLVDLMAVTLDRGLRHIQRRGLDRQYLSSKDEVVGIRGRIDGLTTTRRLMHLHGKSICEFDDLSANCPSNQIIRSTLRRLAATETLDKSLCAPLLSWYRSLRGIDDVTVSTDLFRRVQIHSNNRFYRFLLNVCQLVFQCLTPEEGSGSYKFRDFVREDKAMARVFEGFLFNFARIECPHWDVSRDQILWQAESESDPSLSLLPRMITDLSLRSPLEHRIIDAKYYSETLSAHYGVSKLKSQNLYQLLTYLQNARVDSGRRLSGMLVYPDVGTSIDHTYEICGFPIRVATLNLALPWQEIRMSLLRLLQAPALAKAA